MLHASFAFALYLAQVLGETFVSDAEHELTWQYEKVYDDFLDKLPDSARADTEDKLLMGTTLPPEMIVGTEEQASASNPELSDTLETLPVVSKGFLLHNDTLALGASAKSTGLLCTSYEVTLTGLMVGCATDITCFYGSPKKCATRGKHICESDLECGYYTSSWDWFVKFDNSKVTCDGGIVSCHGDILQPGTIICIILLIFCCCGGTVLCRRSMNRSNL